MKNLEIAKTIKTLKVHGKMSFMFKDLYISKLVAAKSINLLITLITGLIKLTSRRPGICCLIPAISEKLIHENITSMACNFYERKLWPVV